MSLTELALPEALALQEGFNGLFIVIVIVIINETFSTAEDIQHYTGALIVMVY
jgi:hypothetical protein